MCLADPTDRNLRAIECDFLIDHFRYMKQPEKSLTEEIREAPFSDWEMVRVGEMFPFYRNDHAPIEEIMRRFPESISQCVQWVNPNRNGSDWLCVCEECWPLVLLWHLDQQAS